MRNFFREFKAFIARGNVIDLAVAVIIGSAFSAIVTALTNNIIMPLVNYVLSLIGGKEGLEGAFTFLSKGYTDGELDLSKSIYINWGSLITAILNFFIIAMTLFVIVKIFNSSRNRLKNIKTQVVTLSKKEKRAELIAMHKEAKERGISFHKLKKEKEEEKARLEKEQKEAEEKQRQEEIERKARENVDLLREIRDLLKENNNR